MAKDRCSPYMARGIVWQIHGGMNSARQSERIMKEEFESMCFQNTLGWIKLIQVSGRCERVQQRNLGESFLEVCSKCR